MNNIAQIYKNIIRNLIKKEIANLDDNKIDLLVNNLFNSSGSSSGSYSSYVNLISSIQEGSRKIILQGLQEIFEKMDLEIRNYPSRVNMYVVNKSNVPRTIITIFGELTFKRTYYDSKIDGTPHFLLDENLNLPKGDRYDPIVKAEVIKAYTKTNQKQAGEIVGDNISLIMDKLKNINKAIPRQSVYNWLKKWEKPETQIEAKETPSTLYIMIDEKFLGCQDLDNDIMVRSFISFTDEKKVLNNRNVLVNRIVFNTSKKSAWIDFADFIYKIYDSDKIKNIYVMSDGGTWITANISELKMHPDMVIKRLGCEFHFKKYVNMITTDKDKRKEIVQYFKTLTRAKFKNYLTGYYVEHPERKEIIQKAIKYILHNYTAIKAMLNFKIGSSMESHISHILAKPFGSRPKGYSSQNIEKYLKINDDFNNGINIYDLYMRSYDCIEDDETTQSIDNNINEQSKATTSTTYYNTSSIPLFNSSFDSKTNYKLKAMTKITNNIKFI